MKIIIGIISLGLILSCSKKEPAITHIESNDTLIIIGKTAVFVQPDSVQIEKQKKEFGEDIFYMGADDYAYYLNLSHHFLDSIKIPVLNTENKKFIQFISEDNQKQTIKLDTLSGLWNAYFFTPEKHAKKIDITSIKEEYTEYFQ